MRAALQPKSGRTHQIRLHLQWLGHPIVDDPNYGTVLTAPTDVPGAAGAPADSAADVEPDDDTVAPGVGAGAGAGAGAAAAAAVVGGSGVGAPAGADAAASLGEGAGGGGGGPVDEDAALRAMKAHCQWCIRLRTHVRSCPTRGSASPCLVPYRPPLAPLGAVAGGTAYEHTVLAHVRACV